MVKGISNRKYTGEFKQKVVETLRHEKLSYPETAERFGIRHKRVQDWERVYLEDGPEGLYVERRGRTGAVCGARNGRPPKLDAKIDEDLIAENQRLRAENDYLKKLNALVLEAERQNKIFITAKSCRST
ncbi:MAG: helix-turn-helix domain-containing protein [Negativicutes bacterium]|nr:helix-turn-helix domain-containing protein [Negativicutes bacterium]